MTYRLAAALTIAFAAAPVTAQTTRPADTRPAAAPLSAEEAGQLSLRANQAFNRGEYATALPLLKKLAAGAAAEPTRLGSIQERIRVCEKALAALAADPQAAATARVDAPPEAEQRKPHPAPKPGELLEMTIQELGNFQFDQENGGNIPDDVKRLTGAKVRLRGYMIPMNETSKITQFALVPSLFACCFGQPPQIQHTIVSTCPKGAAVDYRPDELVVEGTLRVQEKKDEGYIVSVFEVDVTSVKIAPK